MLARIIFFTAVSAATLAVVLLATVSPSAQRRLQKSPSRPQLALSLYLQHAYLPSHRVRAGAQASGATALIFHHMLTQGPENMSRIVGKAQGFIIPIEHFAHSAFNIIYLTFHTAEYSGCISVEAKRLQHRDTEELEVIGGTGSFAFARGLAVFTRTGQGHTSTLAMYHVKLHLRFPDDRSQTIPG